MNTTLVSVEWLNEHLKKENLIVLDASPKSNVSNMDSPYKNIVIPKARHFNIKENFTDKASSFPNTVPSAEQFEQECRKLGINKDSHIVVYDNLGVYTSPRVWWLFKIMGHENVAVLNGGLPEWVNKKLDTSKKESEKEEYSLGDFEAHFQKKYVKKYEDIIENIGANTFLVIDARSQGRFNGSAKEPRKHLKSGHIANSVNIPYQDMLEDGKFKSVEELRKIFEDKCSDAKQLAFSCGSGLTACIVMLGSELAYHESRYIYDGSWTEWAEKEGLFVEIL